MRLDEQAKSLEASGAVVGSAAGSGTWSQGAFWGTSAKMFQTEIFALCGSRSRPVFEALVQVVDAVAGYSDVEGVPPLNSKEFIECSTRAIVG